PLGQHQSSIAHGEPAQGVLQARERLLGRLEPGLASALDLERMVERLGEGPKLLLLGHLGPLAQPVMLSPQRGEVLAQLAEGGLRPDLHLLHRVVPQKPGAVPLGDQRTLGRRPWAQPVGVADGLHASDYTTRRYIVSTWLRSDPTTTSSTDPPTTSSGAPSTAAPLSRATSMRASRRSSERCALSETAISSRWRRCPTMCTCSSSATRSTASTGSSTRSR